MKYSIACLNMILLLRDVYDFGLNGFLTGKGNDLPTIFEALMGSAKQSKVQSAAQNNGNKNTSSGKVVCNLQFHVCTLFSITP